MKMKSFWLPCLVFLFGAFCASCGSDNDEPTDKPETGGTPSHFHYRLYFE